MVLTLGGEKSRHWRFHCRRSQIPAPRFPLWSCSNKQCQGGSKKKKGEGNYPWGSYEYDPGDAGLIGPAPVREDYGPPEVPLPELREDFGPDEAPF